MKDKAKVLVDSILEETPVKDFINLTTEEVSDELLRDLQVAKQCALISIDFAEQELKKHGISKPEYFIDLKKEVLNVK